jgi:hypothetical protein
MEIAVTYRFRLGLLVRVLAPLLLTVFVTQAHADCDPSVLTAHNNNQRTGAQLCENGLTPQTAPYLQKVAQRSNIGKMTGDN